jgi:hypothetical protein
MPPLQTTLVGVLAATLLPGWQAELLQRDGCFSWLPVGSLPASQIWQPVTPEYSYTLQQGDGRTVKGRPTGFVQRIASYRGHRHRAGLPQPRFPPPPPPPSQVIHTKCIRLANDL